MSPSSAIYWADMLGSALLGYAALFAAMLASADAGSPSLRGSIAVLALYRAGSFIHELTHIKKGAVKGFRFAWNLIVGVPLLVPSFMYEGVHNQHHAKTLLRDRRRPRISAAGADAPVDPAAVPDRRRAGADRHADPLRDPGAAVAAVPRSSGRSSSAAIPGFRSTPSSCARSPKASSRATGRGRRRRAASGRSRCWRWSRPASSRCAIS